MKPPNWKFLHAHYFSPSYPAVALTHAGPRLWQGLLSQTDRASPAQDMGGQRCVGKTLRLHFCAREPICSVSVLGDWARNFLGEMHATSGSEYSLAWRRKKRSFNGPDSESDVIPGPPGNAQKLQGLAPSISSDIVQDLTRSWDRASIASCEWFAQASAESKGAIFFGERFTPCDLET